MPLTDSIPAARVETPAPTAAVSGWQEWRTSGHVLVVDDDEAVRTVLCRTLSRIGLTVSLAANGTEALAIFNAEADKCTLVLLDYKLPGMDSRTVFEELRARKPDIPVILMSGYGEQEVVGSTAATDFTEFLHKPFTMSVLAAKIRSALGG